MAANQPVDVAALIQAFIDANNNAAVANAAALAQATAATAAAAAQAAAAIPAAPVVAPPGPPVPFALLPGNAFLIALDYNKNADMNIFKAAITGMVDKFDLKEDHLRVFLGNIKQHARLYNWSAIIMIPDAAGVNRNLLTNYGQLTKELVKAHELTYVNTETRNAQNSMMLHQYLHESITEEAKLVMETLVDQYLVGDEPSGTLFLKAIIGRASIDTKAKVLLLRESVSHLYMKIAELKGNIRLFNQHTSDLVLALAGRGQVVDELIMHLFKAYKNSPDRQFVRYIEAIRDRYDADVEDITADQLMHLAVKQVRFDAYR